MRLRCYGPWLKDLIFILQSAFVVAIRSICNVAMNTRYGRHFAVMLWFCDAVVGIPRRRKNRMYGFHLLTQTARNEVSLRQCWALKMNQQISMQLSDLPALLTDFKEVQRNGRGFLGPTISDVRDRMLTISVFRSSKLWYFRFHQCCCVQNPLKLRYISIFRHEIR